jgi:hypothetical protein
MDQRLRLEPGANSIAKKTDSWAAYYNFDQYLYEPVKGSGKGVGIWIYGSIWSTQGGGDCSGMRFQKTIIGSGRHGG